MTKLTLLQINNLEIEFPSRKSVLRAVDNVSLSLEKGDILGIVGESGAGKSTVGNALIGLLEPPGQMTKGEIFLDGNRIDNLPDSEKQKIRGKEIGMIFQDPLTSLNPLHLARLRLAPRAGKKASGVQLNSPTAWHGQPRRLSRASWGN